MTAKNGTPVYVTNREHMQMYKALKDDINEVKIAVSQFGEDIMHQTEANAILTTEVLAAMMAIKYMHLKQLQVA